MSRTNETRFIEWHKKCKCKFRLDAIVFNNKQCWNENKCRCECKELTDKGICDKGFIWNPINCECECDKNCNIGEYLDKENCKCRKKCELCHYWFFKDIGFNFKNMFVINVMIY